MHSVKGGTSMKKAALFCVVGLLAVGLLTLMYIYLNSSQGETPEESQAGPALTAKPVIYLYPETETEVSVTLDYGGTLTTTYPAYNQGWQVTARPDGTLINQADGREYSYLFWEGISDTAYDFSEGFVVKGSETAAFLQQALEEMGMTPREYNEMIVYWLPMMEGNPYNLISFQTDRYTELAGLSISPQPDSLLRVFMAWQALEEPVEVPPQEFSAFERTGFTVVEWGGTQVK